MQTSDSRPTRALRTLTALSLAAFVALLALASASAGASPSKRQGTPAGARHVIARASRAVPRPLARAARRSRSADRNLVARARELKRCLATHATQPSACDGARGALQYAGSELKRAENNLASLARGNATAASDHGAGGSAALQAPKLSVSGERLSWTQQAGINSYVFVRKVPGQADQYSTLTGTSTTPPPVPGLTVRYSVRTAVTGSSWAGEQTISYPNPRETGRPEAPPVETPPAETPKTQAAPKLTVSGLALSWSPVGGVSTYVLAISLPGRPVQYTEVSGTSLTPPATPGVTVGYSLRTAVDGSAWSPKVTISYPTKSTPPSSPPPPPRPTPPPGETEKSQPGSPLSSPMWVSVDMGGWPSTFAGDIAGAVSSVRVNTQSNVAGFSAAGLKVIDLVTQEGNSGVSTIDASAYAAKVIADVRADPNIGALELLNEPGNQWFWGTNAGDAANAAAYDQLLKVVHEALVANFGSNYPPVLASYDGGEGPITWGEEMWAADPNVGSYINGITLHSYGGTSNRANSALGGRRNIEAAHAQHPNIPVYITEVGWPTAVGQPSTGDSMQWTESEQAQNITSFVNWAKGTGYIADVTIFNYRDYGSNDFYGVETASGAHKLSFTALAALRS